MSMHPIAHAATLLDRAPPVAIAFDDGASELGEMTRSFYGENKRVSNRKLREELGVEMLYPTYREALTELWASGELAQARPESLWQALVKKHFHGAIKPPFNDSARLAAGLSREFYAEIAL